MKVGIVGAGMVGSAAGYALALRGTADAVVFVDQSHALAVAQAQDVAHTTLFASATVVSAGDDQALAGAEVVVLAAGVSQKPGETRLALLERNVAVFREIVGRISAVAPDAILIIATNPVDVMTWVAARLSGLPPSRVIGSGTILDTARFRHLLGAHLGIAAGSVHAYVLGEHGDSEVLAWSTARAGNVSIRAFAAQIGAPITDDVTAQIDAGVRNAAYTIIEGKGATWYGIGAGIERIVRAIGGNEQAVLSVSMVTPDIEGVRDVALSVPRVVGRDGITADLMPDLNAGEHAALLRSTQILKDTQAALSI